jgi:hypothetical protein
VKEPGQLRDAFEKWLYLLKFGEGFTLEEAPVPPELNEEERMLMAIDSMRKASQP